MRLLCTLCIGLSRKFHVHFTIMFWLRYYKMVQILYKNWLLVSKIAWGIWTTSDKQWKVQKVEIRWVTFVQKIHSTKTLYTEDSSNITFNYLRKSSSNSSCHFWNQKSFFATQLVCIIPVQTLHTFYKSSPSKCKFLDSPNSNSLCHFSSKSQFFFKIWITLRYWQKQHIKVQTFRLTT